MELFDKKYVHFIWEDELEGKEGFVADDIDTLIENVNNNKTQFKSCVIKSDSKYVSFYEPSNGFYTDNKWRFFYYDPNYEVKKAYAEGKQIQARVDKPFDWIDVRTPKWHKGQEYRIKPEEPKSRRMTHRQASEWVSKNGEIAFSTDKAYVFNQFSYDTEFENKELPEEYRIRRWGSDEWIKPTVDVYEQDCKKE